MRGPTWLALLTVVVLAAVLAACNESERAETPRPLVVIGVDGGEWSVIRALWDEGKLPHLKSIADRGTSADLESPYSVSPVIWTSIATGQKPEVHGIIDFVVPTDHGDVPISSALRKVPAIWNLLTLVGRRVSVLGWYATWPAEAVNGLMVTDHVMRNTLPDRVYPPERLAAIDDVLETVRSLSDEETHPFGVALSDRRSERDLLIERIAPSEASEDYDLLMVYYRSIDHLSHFYWKFWKPRHYGNPDPDELAEKSDWIPAGYERFDRLVGEILQASPDANMLIVSDHGFHRGRETLRVFFDMDTLLHHLGYLEWDEDGIDMERSRAFTHRSTKPKR